MTGADVEEVSALIDNLCKLEHDNYDDTINPNYSKSDLGMKFIDERRVGKDSLCLVAEEGNRVIGYFFGSIAFPEEYRLQDKIGIGESMFLEEKYRRQGIGARFLNMFEDWCREQGVRRTRLVASSRNTRAIKLYTQKGYEEYDITLEKNL